MKKRITSQNVELLTHVLIDKVNLSLLQEEWDDIVDYAGRYIDIVQDDYKSVWWKLYNAPSAPRWSNILCVAELIFCIQYPMDMLKDVSHN